jgi:hypothetical protein
VTRPTAELEGGSDAFSPLFAYGKAIISVFGEADAERSHRDLITGQAVPEYR